MLQTVSLSIIRSLALYSNGYSGIILIPLASSQHNLYDNIPIAVYTVLDSWWWTEKLSETCRVLFQK